MLYNGENTMVIGAEEDWERLNAEQPEEEEEPKFEVYDTTTRHGAFIGELVFTANDRDSCEEWIDDHALNMSCDPSRWYIWEN